MTWGHSTPRPFPGSQQARRGVPGGHSLGHPLQGANTEPGRAQYGGDHPPRTSTPGTRSKGTQEKRRDQERHVLRHTPRRGLNRSGRPKQDYGPLHREGEPSLGGAWQGGAIKFIRSERRTTLTTAQTEGHPAKGYTSP